MYEFIGTAALIGLLVGVYILLRDKYFSDKIATDNQSVKNKEAEIDKMNDKLKTDKEAYEKALDDFNTNSSSTDGNNKN